MFNHDCVGNWVKAVPRSDIRRVPALSRDPLTIFPVGLLSVSSGMDLATDVPAPTNVSK